VFECITWIENNPDRAEDIIRASSYAPAASTWHSEAPQTLRDAVSGHGASTLAERSEQKSIASSSYSSTAEHQLSLTSVQSEAIQPLMALGFSREECELAVSQSEFSIPNVVDWLLMRQERKLEGITRTLERKISDTLPTRDGRHSLSDNEANPEPSTPPPPPPPPPAPPIESESSSEATPSEAVIVEVQQEAKTQSSSEPAVSPSDKARARWKELAENLSVVVLKMKQKAAIAMVDAIRKLRASVKTLVEDEKLCIMCFGDEQNTVLLRCGHLKLCATCAGLILNSTRRECPICREPITRVVTLAPVPPYVSSESPASRNSIRFGDFLVNSPAGKRASLMASKAALQEAADKDSKSTTETVSGADDPESEALLAVLHEWHEKRARFGRRKKIQEFEQALREYLPEAVSLLPRATSNMSDLSASDLELALNKGGGGKPINYAKYYSKPSAGPQSSPSNSQLPRSESTLSRNDVRTMRRFQFAPPGSRSAEN